MPALVENMFYTSNDYNNRFVPWHGLGIPLVESPTSADAIKVAGLDWRVEAREIFDAKGNKIPGFVANTRDIDNQVLGVVSNKYKIVQNSEAFEFTDSLLDEGIVYETAGSLKKGRTVWLLAKMPETKILDDTIDPYICFMNTHDGTGSIRVCMTPIRVVCNNTLNLALSSAKRSWSTCHMGNIQEKLEEAKHTLGLANTYIEELDKEANKLVSIKVSDAELEEMFDLMFPINYNEDSQRKINNIINLKNNLFYCYDAPDIKAYKGTAYGIINAATDMVAHMAPNRLSINYQENNWGKIMTGHPFVDGIYKKIAS